MRERRYRRRILRPLLSLTVVVALGTLAFFSVRGAYLMYERMAQALELRRAAQSNLERLTLRERELQAAVEGLSSERGLEGEVRRRYGLALPGEGLIELVREVKKEEAAKESAGLFDWFLRLF